MLTKQKQPGLSCLKFDHIFLAKSLSASGKCFAAGSVHEFLRGQL